MYDAFAVWWKRHCGLIPFQFCMVCGRLYWGGWPWFSIREWQWQWKPWWGDYCSKSCCDEDMDFIEEISGNGTQATTGESGATSVGGFE